MILGIAACFGYFARVRAMAGAEQCFALLPVNASLSSQHSEAHSNSHHILFSRHSLFFFSFHLFVVYLLFVVCSFLGHDLVNY